MSQSQQPHLPGGRQPGPQQKPSCWGVVREECRRKHFALRHRDQRDFYMCQWRVPHSVYMAVRLVLALYATYVLMHYTIHRLQFRGGKILTKLTFLHYIVITLHLQVAAALSVIFRKEAESSVNTETSSLPTDHCTVVKTGCEEYVSMDSVAVEDSQSIKPPPTAAENEYSTDNPPENSQAPGFCHDDKSETSTRRDSPVSIIESENHSNKSKISTSSSPEISFTLPWYFKLSWILFYIQMVFALLVSVVYHLLLHDTRKDYLSGSVHIGNLVIVYTDQLITALPVRLLHAYIPALFGNCYFIFTLIYWAFDPIDNIVYDILDWNKPGKVTVVYLGVVVLAVFVYTIYFAFYKFKQVLFFKIYGYHRHEIPHSRKRSDGRQKSVQSGLGLHEVV